MQWKAECKYIYIYKIEIIKKYLKANRTLGKKKLWKALEITFITFYCDAVITFTLSSGKAEAQFSSP